METRRGGLILLSGFFWGVPFCEWNQGQDAVVYLSVKT